MDQPLQLETTTGEKPERLSLAQLVKEAGASGTKNFSGYLEEEYNKQLQGSQKFETYDKMRKSDGQVAATLLAMTLPIRTTKWYIDPAKNEEGEIEPEDEEIAEFVRKAIFDKMEMTWDEFLEQALTCLDFGFSLFEKVYYSDGEHILIRKLAQRLATSIDRWQTLDGKPGVTQILPSSVLRDGQTLNMISIPASKLVVFTYKKEGTNYEGTSICRPMWKHWWLKDTYYKYEACKHEKQSMGMPIVYAPEGASDEDKSDIISILKNYRVSEESFMFLPSLNWKVEFMDVKSSGNSNLQESIKHHNAMISLSVLAQFLNIVESQMGSRALSEDQSDLFLLTLGGVAGIIRDNVNRYVIQELVALNFNTDRFPKLCFDPLGSVDVTALVSNLVQLSGAGMVKADDNLEKFIRQKMDLPAPIEEEVDNQEEDIQEGEQTDEGDMGMQDMPTEQVDQIDQEQTVTDLENELASLEGDGSEEEYAEVSMDYCTAVECYIEHQEFVAKGGHLDEETKKKISEALKKGGSAPEDLKKTRDQARSVADVAVQKQQKVRDDFQKSSGEVRSQIDQIRKAKSSIPKGKKGAAQRAELKKKVDALRQKINAMKSQKKAQLEPIKQGRIEALKKIKDVNAELKRRKEAVKNIVSKIREEIASGKTDLETAIQPLDTQVSSNRDKAAELRQKLSSLPKGKDGAEQRKAMQTAISGLLEENRNIASQKQGLRKTNKDVSKSKGEQIKQVKKDSGAYHEYGEEERLLFSLVDNSLIIGLQAKANPQEQAELKKKGLVFNAFESQAPRPLTFAERRVNLSRLSKALEDGQKSLEDQLAEIQGWQKEDLLKQAKKAIENNDIEAVNAISVKYKGELATALATVQKDLFEIGKETASVELGVPRPTTTQEARGMMKVQTQNLVDGASTQLEYTTKKTVLDMLRSNAGSITTATSPAIVKEVSDVLDTKIQKLNNVFQTINVTGAVNLGRSYVFDPNTEKVYAYQYSSILDSRTTDRCLSLDGRVVAPGSSAYALYTPPQHPNCRSIWVAIMQDDSFKPDITDIPKSIPATGNIDYPQDLKRPQILKNSPAVKQLQDELEERKAKLEQLKKDGSYPNRQKAHQERIDELEKSLKGKFKEVLIEQVLESIKKH
jgi:hypothetical protein